MNQTPSSHPSPPVGEKVPEGPLKGIWIASSLQCAASKSWRPFMKLLGPRILTCVLESGAEDARTPDADAWCTDSAAREAFGVRPIYRRFLSGAGQPVVQGPNAFGK